MAVDAVAASDTEGHHFEGGGFAEEGDSEVGTKPDCWRMTGSGQERLAESIAVGEGQLDMGSLG